jgi:glycerophosphoryl diester phosphodiesterase
MDLARRASANLGRPIGVYPETKHPTYFRSIGLPLEEALLQALERDEGRTQVYIQSFETGNLRELRKRTDLPLIQLLDTEGQPWDLALAGDGRTYRDLATPAGLAEIATYADGIGPNKQLLLPPSSLVEDAHRAGLLVHPWTFRGDAEEEYHQFFSLGVDGLFSDFPDAAVRARDSWRP